MTARLHYNTIDKQLSNVLHSLMGAKEFNSFRLVGGTALSLYRGHRKSVDIDLFSDATYGTLNFDDIDIFLKNHFSYVDSHENLITGFGKPYFIGNNKDDCVKLDLFYAEKFIQDFVLIDGIRMATVEEIISMKIEVISNVGRKKDFWDIHELCDDYSFEKMLELHKQKYPYTHDENQIRINFSNFEKADVDFDPICLKGKHWELIKLDMIEFANKGAGKV